jgi:hypothetical protein
MDSEFGKKTGIQKTENRIQECADEAVGGKLEISGGNQA